MLQTEAESSQNKEGIKKNKNYIHRNHILRKRVWRTSKRNATVFKKLETELGRRPKISCLHGWMNENKLADFEVQ